MQKNNRIGFYKIEFHPSLFCLPFWIHLKPSPLVARWLKLRDKLKRQAKNNNAEIFQDSIFPKIFKDIANEFYMEQMDAFTKLFENRDFYNAIMAEIGREAYRELRNQ